MGFFFSLQSRSKCHVNIVKVSKENRTHPEVRSYLSMTLPLVCELHSRLLQPRPSHCKNTIKAETLWAVPAQAAKRADQSEQTGPFGMLKRQALKWSQRKLLLLEKKNQLWSNQDSLLKVFSNSLFLSNSNQHKMTCWNDRLKSKYHTGTKRTQWTVEVR